MRLLKTLDDLSNYLRANDGQKSCLADTGFLYAIAYDDDRLFNKANDVLDILSENGISVFANVISRMEFVDLIFRKQITSGAIQIFESLDSGTLHKELFNLLKNIRDQETAHRKLQKSYKIDEARLKNLRRELERSMSPMKWKEFCRLYVGQMLSNEWHILEQEFGLNFIEILEGQTSDMFETPLYWADMVQIMGEHGLRSPDAMIANLFSKSKFPLLITNDADYETCLSNLIDTEATRAIFHLEN
jgi:predicted nucleic acid-binding protein